MKEKIQKTICSIKNIPYHPVESLGCLLPIVMYLVTTLTAIVGYVMFIMADEYSKQISIIKEFGFEKAFTSGTSNMLLSGGVPIAICILAFMQFVIALISYFTTVEKIKRIFMIIDLVILIVCLSIFCNDVGTEEGMFYVVVVVVAIIIIFFLAEKSASMRLFMDIIKNLLFHFIIMPILMLLLENILPLIVGALTLALFLLIFWFILSALGEGGQSGAAVDTNKSMNVKNSKKKEKDTGGKCIEITDYRRAGGIDLYKRHGTFGDYIELDNHFVTRSLCSIAEMKSGKCRLYDKSNGKEITLDQIPWKN